ncbi:MAG: serine/threonine protein kinase [Deltaproteobacteria bacterium]|nr:serine/threonine protein kinase [Deltaproteobacteria bacterium]
MATLVGGRYRLEAVLGAGGMGVVHRAEDAKLRRVVALKLLPSESVGDEESRTRFLREARLAASIKHPSVTTVYDVGEDDQHVYLAMELVEGRSLRAIIEDGRLERSKALDIAAQIAEGVAAAHAVGVIHRDLKPDNVMIAASGVVKILDFGIAKIHTQVAADPALAATATPDSSATREGMILGTPAYMSPEQAKGKAIDDRTDVFAFGVTLFELLTGERPFKGTPIEVVIAADRDPAVRPSSLNPMVDDALDELVLACLEKHAWARPPMSAVAARLRALSRESAPPRPPAAPLRRRSTTWLLAIVGVAAAAASVALYVGRTKTTPSSPSPLARADGVLACPIFDARGIDEPTGWLGAAAADMMCRDAHWLAGGRDGSALGPALLLDLPRLPGETFPEDPYREARARSLEAAKRRAHAWVDGVVTREAEGFTVSVGLFRPDGARLASAEGRGASLDDAIATARDGLVSTGELPRAAALDPEIARIVGTARVDAMLLAERVLSPGRADRCARIARDAANLGFLPAAVAPLCNDPAHAVFDGSSVEAIANTAQYAPAAQVPALLARVRAARTQARSAIARMQLAVGEANLVFAGGRLDDAAATFRVAIDQYPHDLGSWFSLVELTALRDKDTSVVLRGMRAWAPAVPDAWIRIGATPGPERLMFTRRGHALAPREVVPAIELARDLAFSGLYEEARTLAARWSAPGLEQTALSDYIHAVVDHELGKQGSMMTRLKRARASSDDPTVRTRAAFFALYQADAMGLGKAFADEYARTWFLGKKLDVGSAFEQVFVCMRASKDVARACLAGLRERASDPQLPPLALAALTGAEQWLAGHEKEAAATLRPLIQSETVVLGLPAELFERAGEPEVAERCDQAHLALSTKTGVSLGHVRAARRALRSGDKARAKKLAQHVVDGWAGADLEIPTLKEMRVVLEAP